MKYYKGDILVWKPNKRLLILVLILAVTENHYIVVCSGNMVPAQWGRKYCDSFMHLEKINYSYYMDLYDLL